MKTVEQTLIQEELKTVKNFKPLDSKKIESVVGGPITSRGTETKVSN